MFTFFEKESIMGSIEKNDVKEIKKKKLNSLQLISNLR